ncbi:cytidine deaminase [candidate division WOR-3 bacterium]|nr:cytidine deaminase [candidate division WOR-3 bacterium]
MQNNQAKWDQRFYKICIELASWSSCLSRKIGAILVRDRTIIATGYNGPPRGLPHCGAERRKSDMTLFHRLSDNNFEPVFGDDSMCPRQRLGYASGDGLHLCPAAHAEDNCILNAARTGVVTMGATMYVSCKIPCKNCLGKIINAGIVEIVCKSMETYDELSKWMLKESKIKIRTYEKEEA